MTHLSEGAIMALLDDEAPESEAAHWRAHLAECERCGARFESLRAGRQRLTGALRMLDREPDTELAHRRLMHRQRSRPAFGRPLRWAAILVLGGATGLAAAVPGSPVREWLGGAREAPVAVSFEAADENGSVGTLSVGAGPSGVSVGARSGQMRVSLTDAAEGMRIRLHLHDGDEVEVLIESGGENARFHTSPDRIEIRGAAHGEARVGVPRALDRFTLEVGGRIYMVKQGEDLRFPGPPADTTGPAIEFEVRP